MGQAFPLAKLTPLPHAQIRLLVNSDTRSHPHEARRNKHNKICGRTEVPACLPPSLVFPELPAWMVLERLSLPHTEPSEAFYGYRTTNFPLKIAKVVCHLRVAFCHHVRLAHKRVDIQELSQPMEGQAVREGVGAGVLGARC